MTNYLNKNEAELGEKLLKNGYVISKQKDLTHLNYIRNLIVEKSSTL